MAIMDAQATFSDSQAVTSTGDTNSTNVYKTNSQDPGAANGLQVVIECNETVTSGGAATVTFALVTDDNAALSSATTIRTTASFGKAVLEEGWSHTMLMEAPSNVSYEDYVGVVYTVGTAALTAGKFTARVTDANGKTVQNFVGTL